MRIKICGITTREDAELCVAAGADALGFLCGVPSTVRCYLEPAKASAIVAAMPPYVSTVIVTTLSDPAAVEQLAKQVPASTLQLHGPISPDGVAALRRVCPRLRLIKTVPVESADSVREARRWEPHVDALLLDTKGEGDIGGTGRVHNWDFSRRIRQTVSIPVILAGGLTPENVAAAAAAVQPFAVDVNSGVSEGTRKEAERVRAFIAAARI